MTLVVEALNRIARHCSVPVPSGWASATRLEHQEIRDDFLLEAIENIQDRVDLPAPIGKQTTITGTGAESYSLPEDFKRMARDALGAYEVTTLRRAGTPVSTDGLWTHINTIGSAGTFRYFAVEGYPGAHTIKFELDLSTGNTVTVSYVSDRWCLNGTTEKNAFTDDGDVLLLPRRVVETGTIWRWRKRKGMEYQAELSLYEVELSRLQSDSRNIRTIKTGRGIDEYAPMRVPVPDYIPQT